MKKYIYAFIPFACFALGYLSLALIYRPKPLPCPSFVGKTIAQTAGAISSIPLNMRIIEEHVHDHLPIGTIVYQRPQAGQMIKPHQTLFLVISRKSTVIEVPSFIHLSQPEAIELAKRKNFRCKYYMLESIEPSGTIIAQYPGPGTLCEDKNIILYTSNGGTPLRIMPSLKGLTREQAQELVFSFPNITIKEIHNEAKNKQPYKDLIENQKPLAGSIINVDKPTIVYVY